MRKPFKMYGCVLEWKGSPRWLTRGGKFVWKMFSRPHGFEVESLNGYRTEQAAREAMNRVAERANMTLTDV